MLLGLPTSLLLVHCGQAALWALGMQGLCWASRGTGEGRESVSVFFHRLLQQRLRIFYKEKWFESGGDPAWHLASLTPILQIKLQLRGQSDEELLKWRLVIIPLGTAEPHHFNGISMKGKPKANKANTWCHCCKCISV